MILQLLGKSCLNPLTKVAGFFLKLTKIYSNMQQYLEKSMNQARIKLMTYKRGKRSIRVYRPSAHS